MTDFQLGLVVIGAVAVAGVLSYNWLQERAARREAQQHFVSGQPDALLESAPPSAAPRREPTLSTSPNASSHRAEPAAPVLQPAALPDARIDYVIDVVFAAPVPASAWLEAWRPLERRFKQNVLLAASNDGQNWESAAAAQGGWTRYRAGLQLVSRQGVVSEGDALEFRSTVEGITASLSGMVDPTDIQQALERARQLDALCADADIQVVFHLVAPAGASFPLDALRRAAAAAGMQEAAAGFRMRDALERDTFSLLVAEGAADDRPDRLTFSLDVPRTDDLHHAYRAMVSSAQKLAASLGGSLVDDNGTALDERALEAIWRSVDPIGRSLAESGLAPGNLLALRLFS